MGDLIITNDELALMYNFQAINSIKSFPLHTTLYNILNSSKWMSFWKTSIECLYAIRL